LEQYTLNRLHQGRVLYFEKVMRVYGEGIDVEEIFKALKRDATMGKGLKETLRDLQRQTTSPTPTFVVINNSKEEEHVERKTIEKEKQVKQLVEIEQPTKFSSKLVEGGFFDIEVGSPNIPIIVPTKSQSK
jgi:hypothetical protein